MTAQDPDIIEIQSKEWLINTDLKIPRSAIGKNGLVRVDHKRVRSTGCRRGFKARYQIKNGTVYLMDIRGNYEMDSSCPIHANWISRKLPIAGGELLEYIHMGYASKWSEKDVLFVYNGQVVDELVWKHKMGIIKRLYKSLMGFY